MRGCGTGSAPDCSRAPSPLPTDSEVPNSRRFCSNGWKMILPRWPWQRLCQARQRPISGKQRQILTSDCGDAVLLSVSVSLSSRIPTPHASRLTNHPTRREGLFVYMRFSSAELEAGSSNGPPAPIFPPGHCDAVSRASTRDVYASILCHCRPLTRPFPSFDSQP